MYPFSQQYQSDGQPEIDIQMKKDGPGSVHAEVRNQDTDEEVCCD